MYRPVSAHQLVMRLLQNSNDHSASFLPPCVVRQLTWFDERDDFNAAGYSFFTQYIDTHFIDIEQDVDDIQGTVTSVKLPYERVLPTQGEWFESTRSHMVRRASRLGDFLIGSCVVPA